MALRCRRVAPSTASIASIWRCPDDFRFTPDSRPSSEGSTHPKRADSVAKVFLHHRLQILWAVRSTIEYSFEGLRHIAMNSQATSVMAWRLYRSAISARLVYLREIGRAAFWEFCNTICQQATLETKPPIPESEECRRRSRATATLAAVAVTGFEGQRLGSEAITSPASASSKHGVTVNGRRSAHWATHRYMAFGSVDSEIANPLPSMPCQRPNILTPSGGAPPVSRKRATAALKVP